MQRYLEPSQSVDQVDCALTQAFAGVGFEPARDLPGLSTVRFGGQTMVLLGRVTPEVAAKLALVIVGGTCGGPQ